MGLFDFLKKKKKEMTPSADKFHEESEVEQLSADDSAPGWEAITEAFERLYPDQPNPKHYGTVVKYMFGGSDPLDGISIYDAGDFWHFVTYGFSELYVKESDTPEYSGFGFELTFKLKKSDGDDEDDIRGVCSNLQTLARYVFKSGNVIAPVEYIYTRQKEGIDVQQASKLTGFITAEDDLLEMIETPHGRVVFVTLIGATDAELESIYQSETSKLRITELLSSLGNQVTDYERDSLI